MPYIFEQPMFPQDLGIGCQHAEQAVKIGQRRLKALYKAKAGTEAIRDEIAHTDPMVIAAYIVTLQQNLFVAHQGLQAVAQFRDEFGDDVVAGAEELMQDAWHKLSRIMDEWMPRIQERVEHLHDEDGELVPWSYPDSGATSGASEKAELTPEDRKIANRLLEGFGGELFDL